MGFVRIFWKNNVHEAYLPKMSISGQIVSEMLAGYTRKTQYKPRPVTREGARGAFAPSPEAPKVRILILNIQVKECSQLNWSFKLNSDI